MIQSPPAKCADDTCYPCRQTAQTRLPCTVPVHARRNAGL